MSLETDVLQFGFKKTIFYCNVYFYVKRSHYYYNKN